MKGLRIIGGIVLLVAGFCLGTAFKNDKKPVESPKNLEETIQKFTPKKQEDEVTAAKQSGLLPQEKHTIQLFEDAAPSVAYITTSNVRRSYYRRNLTEVPRGSGSAFVWDKKGHIVTNYHVIQGADRAKVTLSDQSSWDATLVGVASEKDLAVLKIDAPTDLLFPVPVGQSESLMVGQSVYAIGNPFGLDQTLTTGIISALGREIESVAGIPIKGVIQSDAAINPGNSGGPLLDSSGKLIGVNTAIYSPSGASAGIGFSIPVDVVSWIVPDLIQHGKVIRPTLGVELATPQIMRRLGLNGALVIHIIEGSAAETAGIRPTMYDQRGQVRLGDIIVGINDHKITSNNDLVLALEEFKSGDKVSVKVIREEQESSLDLVLD